MTMTEPRTKNQPPYKWSAMRRAYVEGLEALGGEVRSKNGRATILLNEQLAKMGKGSTLGAIVASLKGMEEAGIITREMRGRRTYAIRLVNYQHEPEPTPEDTAQAAAIAAWVAGEGPEPEDLPRPVPVADALAQQEADDAVVSVSYPRPTQEEVLLSEVERVAPEPLPSMNYTELAAALLAQVMATIDAGDVTLLRKELDAVKARLGVQVDEGQRLRRKLDASTDEVIALKREVESLRGRLRSSEANLAAVVKSGSAAVEHDTREAIGRFMRERPHPGK